MNYIEINNKNDRFYSINLDSILLRIESYIDDYIWSIQLIDGVGNIKDIIGMNIVELENYCNISPKGFIIEYKDLMKLAKVFEDIIDIVIVGCISEEDIPEAYKAANWEVNCKVIISREDSSLWQLFSQNSKILWLFKEMAM